MYKLELYGIEPEDIEPILQEQAGQGGFQDLLNKIKKQYSNQTKILCLYKEDIERLYRYTHNYGSGGFQDRISTLFQKMNQVIDYLMQYRQDL